MGYSKSQFGEMSYRTLKDACWFLEVKMEWHGLEASVFTNMGHGTTEKEMEDVSHFARPQRPKV